MAWSKVVVASIFLYTITLIPNNYVRGVDPTGSAGRASSSAGDSNSGVVIEVHSDAEFNERMANHDGKLVVVDYYTSWCGPCRIMAPHFQTFASKYPQVTFLKVNIEECRDTATERLIQTVPTFVCYRNKKQVESVLGAKKDELETMIRVQMAQEKDGTNLTSIFVDRKGSECLNCGGDRDNERFLKFLEDADTYLESDSTDPKLVMSITFTQMFKLHSLRINAPQSNGPKTVKLYTNLPNILDFDDVYANPVKQTLELKSADLDGKTIVLMGSRFPQVRNLQIFVESNQSEPEIKATKIDNLVIIGSSI